MSEAPESHLEAARRAALAELRTRGVEPFAYRYDRTHSTADALAALTPDQEVSVRVAGRLVALRGHGKTMFAHLEDATGRIQLYFRRDELGDDRYELVRLLHLGDIVGVDGKVFVTRTDRKSVV